MTNEKLNRGISKLDNNSKNVHGIIKNNCVAENNFFNENTVKGYLGEVGYGVEETDKGIFTFHILLFCA